MKNNLLLTTALVLATTSAHAFNLELTPYVSGKLAYTRMQSKADVDSLYRFKNPYANTFADTTHKDNVFGLRLATGVKIPVGNNALRGEFELGWNSEAKDSNTSVSKIGKGWTIGSGSDTKDAYTNKFESKLSVYSAMINVYYDINTNTAFTPYVGAGIGYAHLKNKTRVRQITQTGNHVIEGAYNHIRDSESSHNFAYSLNVGVAYAVNDKLTLDLGYRYSDYGTVKQSELGTSLFNVGGTLDVNGKFDVTSHEVLLGARYAF